MAIDLDAIRRKHEQLQSGSSGGLEIFQKIEEGTNMCRIMPGKDDDTAFYAETAIHRVPDPENPDKVKNVHCRKVHNEECPLCEAYYAMWKLSDGANTEEAKDEFKARARKLKPGKRFYLNSVNVGQDSPREVKILSVGIKIFEKILGAILDEDYGDITDFKSGHDFKIIKKSVGLDWPNYDQSAPRPKPSKAGSDQETAAWMESLHDIHGLVKLEEYAEVKSFAMTALPELFMDPDEYSPKGEDGGVSDSEYSESLKA